ncbi:MAG: CDP-alcohol phosphatidyltransferase family protein [Pseudomonadota bacterium]
MARLLTAANALTALRAALIAPCALAVHESQWLWAALAFTAAAVSDFYDGRLARARGESSALGGLFDHATDALFVAAVLLAASTHSSVTIVLVPLVLLAFAQYTLDSAVLSGRALRGSLLGRVNGIGYFVLAGFAIGVPFFRGLLPVLTPVLDLLAHATWVASIGLAITTVLSMANRARYWWRYRSG